VAEIRCPMCGKPNSADAEVCRYCEARIKPLWMDSPANATSNDEDASFDGFDLPDWLKANSSEPTAKSEQASDGTSQPDWLRGLRADSENSADFEEPVVPSGRSGDEEAPDWLRGLLPDTDQPPASEVPLMADFEPVEEVDGDWLQRIDAHEQPKSAAEEQAEELEAPDWLSVSRQEPLESAEQAPEPLEEAPKLPDWLSKLKETPPPEPDLFDQNESSQDWFADSSDAVLSGSESSYPAENIPDWFAGMDESIQPMPEPEPVDDGMNLPDWLAGVISPAIKPAISAEIDFPETTPEIPPAGLPAMDLDEAIIEVGAADLGAGLKEPAEKEDLFSSDYAWLDEMQLEASQNQAAQDEYATEESFDLDESVPDQGDALPDWLSRVPESSSPAAPAFAEEGPAEELPVAELPYWLKAMRPVAAYGVESVVERTSSDQAEKSGPLAGLMGALPAEPDISQGSKPPAYSSKLQITDTQKVHAQLFAELIQAEGEPKSLPSEPLIKSGSLIRIMIALILFAVVILSSLTGFPALSQPAVSADILAAHQLVAGVPPGSRVMIAVDYAPGFSAEVEAGLSALTTQLEDQGCHLIFVSSLPAGPIQSAHFVNWWMKASPPQQSLHWTNLGYIPGGATGLLAFAQNPTGVLPYDVNGNQAWSDPYLLGFRSLTDLSILIVATENPDTARAWVEQVLPLLGRTPLMMVLSAQSAPVIRPYYDSYPRQVQALMGGISAAVEYDVLIGQTGISTGFWSPFTAALSVTVLLILIGAVLNFGLAALARSRSSVRGEGKK